MFNQMALKGGYFHIHRDKYLEIMRFFFHDKSTNPLFVLDIGCGVGEQAEVIASLGHHVVGIDISFNSVKIAREMEREKHPELIIS